MWPSIDNAIPVRRPTAQMPALLTDLRQHGRGGAEPGSLHLPPGLGTQQHQQLQVRRVVQVDRAVELGQPQLNSMRSQQPREMDGLTAEERPLVLPHHDRVEPTVRVGDRGQQPSSV